MLAIPAAWPSVQGPLGIVSRAPAVGLLLRVHALVPGVRLGDAAVVVDVVVDVEAEVDVGEVEEGVAVVDAHVRSGASARNNCREGLCLLSTDTGGYSR